ncbi:cell envelope integrity protein TolA [uncultured Ferrimonas sp.]|uniref:cell envelope integrity protein TolA n=1 Tax=uncultured Ferrimonas sp. TaxID=432640 RepID=UPI002634BEC0|nr:cell envelope integrity protein TolA [uncultured Ferrimonas sp.]
MTGPILGSVLLHVAVVGLLMFSVDFSAKPLPQPNATAAPIVQATMVDQAKVQQQVERIKAQEAAQRAAEQKRQQDLDRQLKEAKRKNKAEQERLKNLEQQKKQRQAELKKAEAAAKQAKLKKEAEQKKAQQAAKQRQQEEQAQQAAEKKRKQAEEQARKAEELRKRKEAERKAAEAERKRKAAAEAARKAAEAELAAQMEAEQTELNRARQQQVLSEVDRYAILIQQAIKRNLRSDTSTIGKECQVKLNLAPDGFVFNYSVLGGDSNLCRATEAAIKAAGNLPVSAEADVYEQMKEINLRIALEK